MTDGEKTKLLINQRKEVLLFKSPTTFLNHINRKEGLYDKKNTLKWSKELKKPVRSDITINIDLLQNAELNFEDRKSFSDLINAWSFIDDYAYQTEDKKILRICQSKQIKNLFDLSCNLYLWTRIEKNIQKNIKVLDREKVIELLGKLYDLFLEKVIVVK